MKPEIRMNLQAHKYRQTIEEINRQFYPGELGVRLDWQLKDKYGRVVDWGQKKGESFTRQFLELLIAKFVNADWSFGVPIRAIDNTIYYIMNSAHLFESDGVVGDVNMGIIVGTGVTAPTINDYVVETIIPHDSGGHAAGTLQYSQMTFGLATSDATSSHFTCTRNFSNATVGDITVNEIALYVKAIKSAPWSAGTTTQFPAYFMTIRDVIAGGILIQAGQTLTINYRPQTVL